MKRIILLLMVLFSMTICNAQRYEGIAKTLSVRVLQNYGWSNWSTPEKTYIKIVVNVSKSKVIIYSKKPQVYNILYAESHYYDSTDGIKSECWEYRVLDQDDDVGTLAVRCGKNWMQVYIRFADIQWVYYLE